VRGGTDREPELVLDPCLLYPAAAKTKRVEDGEYAVVYGHGFPKWLKRKVCSWSQRSGKRLVTIGYSNDFADEQRIADGPAEFAQLMSGAGAVITNFFHGCIFALLNGKPWATAPSDYRSIKIPDLAASLGAKHRLVDEQTDDRTFAKLLDTPVQQSVENRVGELRAQSEAYLDAALA
jgi:hypothetical protein